MIDIYIGYKEHVQGGASGRGPWLGWLKFGMFHHTAWAVGSYREAHQPGNSPNLSQPNPGPRPPAPLCTLYGPHTLITLPHLSDVYSYAWLAKKWYTRTFDFDAILFMKFTIIVSWFRIIQGIIYCIATSLHQGKASKWSKERILAECVYPKVWATSNATKPTRRAADLLDPYLVWQGLGCSTACPIPLGQVQITQNRAKLFESQKLSYQNVQVDQLNVQSDPAGLGPGLGWLCSAQFCLGWWKICRMGRAAGQDE